MRSATKILPIVLVGLSLPVSAGNAQSALEIEPLTSKPKVFRAADFRISADQILSQTESYQLAVFSGAVSGIPKGEVIDRINAPPLVAILQQEVAILDRTSGMVWRSGEVPESAAYPGGTRVAVGTAPGAMWQPGKLALSADAGGVEVQVEQTALRRVQGFMLKYTLHNPGARARSLTFVTAQAPLVKRPTSWGFTPQYRAMTETLHSAPGEIDGGVATHSNAEGAIAFGLSDAAGVTGRSVREAIAAAWKGSRSASPAAATALWRTVDLPPKARIDLFLVVAVGEDSTSAVRSLLADPARAATEAETTIDDDIRLLFSRMPVLNHPDARVTRFYHAGAMQLLCARWRLPGKLLLDPWYASLGLDSGGMNAYIWGSNYVRVPLTLFDPAAVKARLLAFTAAPIAEHYSIDAITGAGLGPVYSHNAYAFVSAVDEYLRVTGDRSVLKEVRSGKSMLDWLIAMAEYGESTRDPDGNNLLDYGSDQNLLELKKTGNGPGYVHEVPSPNAERAYTYDTVADILAEEDNPKAHAELIGKFRKAAARVRRAVNSILWLEEPGWYGTRQRNGAVVPVYSIQIFDLLRVPGMVSRERALRLAAHINDDEFLGPWGVRSLSRRDRLWDWRDHDHAGPMTFMGDAAQLVADLFQAGMIDAAWRAWERILWWPEHLAIWPQGIANDDYSSRFPPSARFGGRLSAGLTNALCAAAGPETVIRGLFGADPGRDGSIAFAAGRRSQDGPSSLAYPFRGHTWNVTQRREGLDVRREDGLAVSLFREDGRLRFAVRPQELVIEASTRLGGAGRLTVAVPFLKQHLKVRTPAALSVRAGDSSVSPGIAGDRLVLDLDEVPAHGVQIRITQRATGSRAE